MNRGAIWNGLRLPLTTGIIGVLIILSIIAVAIAIEKYLFYRRIDLDEYADRTVLEMTLTGKLNVIATIGSNAPYIGLLGTVLGIMFTFYTVGNEGYMDPGRIMVGLALALKATAVGLLVAIPSVTLNNFLLRKARVLMMQWEMKNGRQGIR